MAYDVRTVANEFLRLAWENGRELTNMQLQKLVYIAHGYSLALVDLPLVKQPVQAWRYGPVIKALYDSLRHYGAGTVTEKVNILPSEEVSETFRALISVVGDAYGRFSGPQLSTMTHRKGTPWREVFDPAAEFNNEVIPNQLIKNHYLALLHERSGINPG